MVLVLKILTSNILANVFKKNQKTIQLFIFKELIILFRLNPESLFPPRRRRLGVYLPIRVYNYEPFGTRPTVKKEVLPMKLAC